LAIVFLVTAVGTACECEAEESAVKVLNPEDGATLELGEFFIATAAIKVNYEIESIRVSLWDVMTDWKETWVFVDPSWSKTVSFTETIEVPADAPLGDDYRLQVAAMADGYGSGYSTQVKVGGAQ